MFTFSCYSLQLRGKINSKRDFRAFITPASKFINLSFRRKPESNETSNAVVVYEYRIDAA